jgi:hypothetical protein
MKEEEDGYSAGRQTEKASRKYGGSSPGITYR